MAEKNIKTRIQHKHDSAENWSKAINFIPWAGELIVYDVDETHSYPRFKVGDGKTTVVNLAFANESGIIAQVNWEDISNKPFYEINELVDILPSIRYEGFYFSSEFQVHLFEATSSYSLKNGEEYKIFWDGEEYNCIATDVSEMIPGYVAVGNLQIFNESWPGKNEPFILASNGTYAVYVALTDTEAGGAHEICICEEKVVIYPLDKKYIPIPFFGQEEGIIFSGGFEDEDQDGQIIVKDDSGINLIKNETYNIMWNGELYSSKCVQALDFLVLGNIDLFNGGDNGMPFVIIRDIDGKFAGEPSWVILVMNPTEEGLYTLTILGKGEKKIEQQYLYQPDWNNNNNNAMTHIKNKPFGEYLQGNIICPNTIIETNQAFGTEGYFETIDTVGFIEGKRYEIGFDNGVYTITASNLDGKIGCYSENPYFAIIDKYNNLGQSILVTASSGKHSYCIAAAENIVKTIDPKFIPEIEALPPATIADNGKFLRVVNGTAAWSTVLDAESIQF